MNEMQAKLILTEYIPANAWSEFTDWLEFVAEDGSCDHDPESYLPFLRRQGAGQPEAAASAIYDAMAALAYGPCACAAAMEIWPLDLHSVVHAPVVWCRPSTLPRALTGSVGPELLDRFFGASRAPMGPLFAAVPEPDLGTPLEPGLEFAVLMSEIAARDRVTSWMVVTTTQTINHFFHTGDPVAVERWLRDRGHDLVPFEEVLGRLAVLVVQDGDGKAAREVAVVHEGGERSTTFDATRPDVAIGRVDSRQIWADSGWRTLPDGPIQLRANGELITLAAPLAPGVRVIAPGRDATVALLT